MSHGLSPEQLDEILSLQLTFSWAGESPEGDAPRLGWWRTDLVDDEGGGAFWARLLPRTHRWAGLAAARKAASQTDAALRRPQARGDAMRTLFHFGFELDEALEERLAHHKLEARDPVEVLPLLAVTRTAFVRAHLMEKLGELPGIDFKVTPGGRQLKAVAGESSLEQARRLSQALLAEPTPRAYPLPFILEEAARAGR